MKNSMSLTGRLSMSDPCQGDAMKDQDVGYREGRDLMARYKKRPVVVDAIRFKPEKYVEVNQFLLEHEVVNKAFWKIDHLIIETLEGNMRCKDGDWLIIGVAGELYSCRPDIFEKTYMLLE